MTRVERSGRRLVIAGAIAVAVAAAAAWRAAPPAPRGAGAPPEAFAAERARAALGRILAGAGPHPVGSPADDLVRGRLVAELRAVGLAPELHRSFACSNYGTCGRVVNVTALVPGTGGGAPVAVATHHDSVGAGPGASDAGSGMAVVVEVARALRAAPPLPRPVLLLVTDGEEAGLLGAQAFLDAPPPGGIAAVVNLEARGTTGPSLLFEVTGPQGPALRAARALPRPATSSLFAGVYERLPNDTDLTVLARSGAVGVNLAFIGGVRRYHTPVDDLPHLDLGSLQHHGDNALALVRALASDPGLGAPSPGRSVWFDVLSLGIASWPEPLSVPLAVAALLVACAATVLAHRRGARPWQLAAGAGASVLALAVAAAVPAALRWALARAGALPADFVAAPGPYLVACALLGTAAALAWPALAWRAPWPDAVPAGHALVLGAAAVAVAAAFPPGSHLAIVPALATAAAALAPRPRAAWSGLAAAASALVLAPVALQLPTALGLSAAPATALLAAIVAAPLARLVADTPRRTRAALPAGLAVAAVGAAALQLALPPWSPDAPRHLPVLHDERSDQGVARVLLPADGVPLPTAMAAAGTFRRAPAPPYLWLATDVLESAVPATGAPAPALEVLATHDAPGRHTVRARVRSPRGAPEVALAFPPGLLLEGSVEGHPLAWTRHVQRLMRSRVVAVLRPPPEGVEVELVLAGPGEALLLDRSPGLPPEAARVAGARPPWASTVQDGDLTVVSRMVRL